VSLCLSRGNETGHGAGAAIVVRGPAVDLARECLPLGGWLVAELPLIVL